MYNDTLPLSQKFVRKQLALYKPVSKVKGYKTINPTSPNAEIRGCYLCGSKEQFYYKDYCKSCVEEGYVLVENPQLIKNKGQEQKTLAERVSHSPRYNEEYWKSKRGVRVITNFMRQSYKPQTAREA